MAEIPLTQGRIAIVDDEDYDWLMEWRWLVNSWGYVARSIHRGQTLMHRLILNAPAGTDVDHINSNRLDNRRCNLRLASRAQNNRNRKSQDGTFSKYKGVGWRKDVKKWRAQITVNYKNIHLGYFDTEIEAAKAYDVAAHEHFADFAYLNFPEEQTDD